MYISWEGNSDSVALQLSFNIIHYSVLKFIYSIMQSSARIAVTIVLMADSTAMYSRGFMGTGVMMRNLCRFNTTTTTTTTTTTSPVIPMVAMIC